MLLKLSALASRRAQLALPNTHTEGAFDPSFHRISAFLKSKLAAFISPEQCGRWNETLIAEVQADDKFRHGLSSLHEWATELSFPQDRPTTDGLDIVRVEIELQTCITVVNRLWYFVDRNGKLGHSVAHSRFTLRRSRPDSATYTASFGLGLRDSSGAFWYPRTGRDYGRSDDTPENDADWAFFRSHT